MKTKLVLLAITFSLLSRATFESHLQAESPFDHMFFPFTKVDANPSIDYRVTDKQGPWMVLATSFHGEGAEQQARQLVLELRRDHKLEAFTHRKIYDYTDRVEGRGVDKYGHPKTMVYNK